jgi:ATP-dependent helicase/nuclease subunit A
MAGPSASPADVGIATHLVLRHLDFGRPCDTDDLNAQISKLVERQIITASQANLADRDALNWLVQSALGALLRSHAKPLRRELPIHVSAAPQDGPEPADPQDHVMLRGRVDLLVPTGGGIVLVDYKTDSIAPAAVAQRAQSYASQLTQYRCAIEHIVGKPISQVYLVFLSPRVIWSCPAAPQE